MTKATKTDKQPFKLGKDAYLEGPKSRTSELMFTLDVAVEFIKAFRKLHFVGPCITIFGSARFREGHRYYELAREAGAQAARSGFTVMTGGGPGVMEAANRGAYEEGGRSVGCNIILPHEQQPNPYMQTWVSIKYFFVRKVVLQKYSYAFIVMPGGWGTMDEMFETLTLVQTGSIQKFPVVLIGTEYYGQLWKYVEFMAEQGTISPSDLLLIKLTDDIDEAMQHIQKYVRENYTITRRKRPLWWLFEKV